MIVVTGRTNLRNLEVTTISMMNIRLEPLSFLWKIVGLESGKITSYLWIEISLTFQGGNH